MIAILKLWVVIVVSCFVGMKSLEISKRKGTLTFMKEWRRKSAYAPFFLNDLCSTDIGVKNENRSESHESEGL